MSQSNPLAGLAAIAARAKSKSKSKPKPKPKVTKAKAKPKQKKQLAIMFNEEDDDEDASRGQLIPYQSPSGRIAGREAANRQYPRSDYGRQVVYVKRGTPENIERYGRNARKADGNQLYNRGFDRWTGEGAYLSADGRTLYHGHERLLNALRRPQGELAEHESTTFFTGDGSFWSDIWDGIKTAASDVYSGVKTVAEDAYSGAKDVAGEIWHEAKPLVHAAGRELITVGKNAATNAISDLAGGQLRNLAGNIMKGNASTGIPALLGDVAETGEFIGAGAYFIPEYIMDMIQSHPEGQALIEAVQNGSVTHIEPASKMSSQSTQTGSGMPTFARAAMGQAAMGMKRQRGVIGSGIGDMGNPEYRMNNLINYGAPSSRTNPMIKTVDDETGDLIFSYREYIKDIQSADTNFQTVERVDLNPGLSDSFPLLSRFASLFEEYDFEQLIFHFKSLVTEGNATAAGSVMVVPHYNPSGSVLGSKRAVENTDQCVSGKVTGDLYCGIECDNKKSALGGLLYTRTTDVPRDQRRTYDMGFVQVALQGCPAGLHIGELWVDYRVRLSKLRVNDTVDTAVGDGLFFVAPSPPRGSIGYQLQSVFGAQVPNLLSPSTPSGVFGNGILHVAPNFTNYAIQCVQKPYNGVDCNWSQIACTIAVQAGQKILLQLINVGTQLFTPSQGNTVNDPNIIATLNASNSCTIPMNVTGSQVASALNDNDISNATNQFGEQLISRYLFDFPMGQFVQQGVFTLGVDFIVRLAPEATQNFGNSTLSIVRVPYDYVVPPTQSYFITP